MIAAQAVRSLELTLPFMKPILILIPLFAVVVLHAAEPCTERIGIEYWWRTCSKPGNEIPRRSGWRGIAHPARRILHADLHSRQVIGALGEGYSPEIEPSAMRVPDAIWNGWQASGERAISYAPQDSAKHHQPQLSSKC